MKFLIKLLLKAGITLGVMFIGYKYMLTGGLGGFQIPGMESLGNKTQKGITEIGNAVVDKDVTVYQWVDDKGITHYGGTPPTGQGTYTKKEIHANTNVMNAPRPKQEEDVVENTRKSRVSQVGSVYSPEGVKKLMDDAKGIDELMKDRVSDQEKLLDSL